MNADQFVKIITDATFDGAVRSTPANLSSPPGTCPPRELVELSEWFNALSDVDRDRLQAAMRLVAGHALTAFLSIIDGANAIESGPNKGKLELFYVKGAIRLLLNDPTGEPLNDKVQ